MQSIDLSRVLVGEYRTMLATDIGRRLYGVLIIGTEKEWSYWFVVEVDGSPEIYYSLASAIRRFDKCKEESK